MNNPKIEIDLEVYKAIFLHSKRIDEPINDILRRILKIGTNGTQRLPKVRKRTGTGGLHTNGILLPNGIELRKQYKGKEIIATVKNGKIHYNNKTYPSPSAAAVAATKTSVNGWKFWEYYDEDSKQWKLLDTLRLN